MIDSLPEHTRVYGKSWSFADEPDLKWLLINFAILSFNNPIPKNVTPSICRILNETRYGCFNFYQAENLMPTINLDLAVLDIDVR